MWQELHQLHNPGAQRAGLCCHCPCLDFSLSLAVNIDTKVNLDAQKAQEYPVPANFANAKVMLWTKDFAPLANVLN